MDPTLLFPLIILLLFVPLFLSMRKQRRQMTEMQQLQSALTEGDVVMTTSGLRGTIVDASYEETIDIEIAEGVVTTWVRAAVRQKIEPEAEERSLADGATPAVVDAPAAPATDAPVAETAVPSLEKKSDSANGNTRS